MSTYNVSSEEIAEEFKNDSFIYDIEGDIYFMELDVTLPESTVEHILRTTNTEFLHNPDNKLINNF